MSHQLTFLPSGRTCQIEAKETILAACLRAGLSPVYGCSNGNCGSCKARLVSGDIARDRHFDHLMSAQEKLDGTFLMCAHRAAGDLEIEADVTQSAADIPLQQIDTKVKAIELLDPRVARLHLQTPRSTRLRFIAGQSVTLRTADGTHTTVALANCPCDDRDLMLHIANVPGDAFSEQVFDGGLRPRETVQLTGPLNDGFHLNQSDRRDSLILCWYTGFAPVIGLIEHALSLELERDIHLFRFSPTPGQPYLPTLGRSWADAFDNVFATLMPQRISLMSTREACVEAFEGIAAQFPNHGEMNIYVAGSPNFVAAAEHVFGTPNRKAGRIRIHVDWQDILA